MDRLDDKMCLLGKALKVCETIKFTCSVGQCRKVQRKGRQAGVADFKRLLSDVANVSRVIGKYNGKTGVIRDVRIKVIEFKPTGFGRFR